MKITVIVPVYNSEKYVERCIKSILDQSHTDFELILIDDGSSDSSLAILQEYAKKDSRIRVIYQSNCGPGIARNRGLEIATGEYVVFVDSDDIIDKNYLLYLSAKSADIVFIDVNQVDEDLNILKREYMSDKKNINKDEFLRSQMTGKIEWGGVRKAVKLKLLKKNDIKFSVHKIGEEAIFSFHALYYANSIDFIDVPVYNYVNRAGSQSDYKLNDPWGPIAFELKNIIKQMGLYKKYADSLNTFFVTAAIVSLDRIAQQYSYNKYRRLAKDIIGGLHENFDNNYSVDYNSMDKKVKKIYPFINKRCYFAIFFASKLKNVRKK
ncbi:glycosyltransferase family 2 protein [Clostridium perfringens]|uniref:glycosyltransferase family 2 protein n=1 Tax=Clostridium perfringens TaxID=1502 RepID=UPI0024BD2280|nr:glycosyltransferase family 2 protein [Clostridium perfringens]